ncbi:MAG TPA: DUF4139 domain-containing protein, partial [Roseiarcus sp.]|nr:DUF4139 domain-containing protein [Roseiarcus sp.]
MGRRWFCGVAVAALLAAGEAQAADLALKRVLLSTGGVGLFEYEADVEGDATVEWQAPLDQIDDILKSVVVFDDRGGVGGLDLVGPKSLAETFRALPFAPKDLQSTPALLAALRGAEVEVGGARAIKGRIVAVNEETEARPDGTALTTRHRVSVMTDAGLEQFVLEQADSVRLVDPAVRAAIAKALAAVAADSERGARLLRLTSNGEGKRKLHVAYLAAAPVWKVSYRLVLNPAPDAKTAALQGWATLENFSGQDWSGVDLTLVSGRPVSYRQQLYRAYRVQRPEAPLDIGPQLNPQVDRGALAPMAAAPAMGKARAAPMRVAEGWAAAQVSGMAHQVEAQEGETEVAFPLPNPVSLANGRSLSLPIVNEPAPAARVAIYDPATDARHPLSAAELVNDGKTALPPGVVTIYERGEAGPIYVGDSRLSATPVGDNRLLAYALDQNTTIAEDDSDTTSLARARIANGVLTLDDLTRRRVVYRVKATAPRKLIVVAPKLEGGKLTEPAAAGVTEADGRYRVPFDVKVGEQSFAVTQERTDTRLIALAGLDDAALAVYAKSGAIDAATREALQKLGGLRAAEADAERA